MRVADAAGTRARTAHLNVTDRPTRAWHMSTKPIVHVDNTRVPELPGEFGDSVRCLAGPGERGILTAVGGFGFGRRNVAAGFVEPSAVEPVDVLHRAPTPPPGCPTAPPSNGSEEQASSCALGGP